MMTVTETETTTKFSQETLEVLKNFSSINSNILVEPGSVIKTISPVKNVLAEARVSETFDTEFGIWDLNKFLSTVSLFTNPEFQFHEKYVIISGGNGSSVKYFYSEPNLLTTVNKKLNMPESVVDFELTESDYAELLRAGSVLQLPDLTVRSTSEGAEMYIHDRNDVTSNSYSITIEDLNGQEAEFEFNFKVENLKMMSGNYQVSITDKVVSRFVSTTKDLTYWIALESDSKYNG
tara:strand:- start:584 stop:1288 length:705 start_codon:yes stop_codon:yes gene_type:complete